MYGFADWARGGQIAASPNSAGRDEPLARPEGGIRPDTPGLHEPGDNSVDA